MNVAVCRYLSQINVVNVVADVVFFFFFAATLFINLQQKQKLNSYYVLFLTTICLKLVKSFEKNFCNSRVSIFINRKA